ncbi:hypothetical protein Dform_01800 [Dehalogenimonas formicexedens]|uniref:GH26 domain-containing protein n=2 Tax=Dehalogenimonas formicexedens TaxID=1839801 RepID=A0A1P8F9H8_9CHLR|nr:hypothetical protein Dform_01800 [Dehalogenimonas formicexedens]
MNPFRTRRSLLNPLDASLRLLVLVALFLLPGCHTSSIPTLTSSKAFAPLEPEKGVYWGANLDWGNDSVSAFTGRLGLAPAVLVYFVNFPIPSNDQSGLDAYFQQVSQSGAIALLTLEPFSGLQTVTADEANRLADYVAAKNKAGIRIMLRFAHEMNGSWYPWSQQPTACKVAFQRIADAVHAKTPDTAMIWAPNNGGGYPFTGGQYEAKTGTPDFKTLDTNGDGKLDQQDDPYAPYYPGDNYVDWVGMSLYHWGNAYPWGENEVPESTSFIDRLTGNYNGLNGDERAVPDFYNDYAVNHGKPLAITETSALYSPQAGGPGELEIKRAWWNLIFSQDVFNRFPQLKMINWFEWRKYETEISDIVDWTISLNPEIRSAFVKDFPKNKFILGRG